MHHDIVPADMEAQGSGPRDRSQPEHSPRTKRAYKKPVIRDYGSVASLTAGATGSVADGAFSMQMA